MHKTYLLLIAGTLAVNSLMTGCQSEPLTPAQQEAYQKEQTVLQYENQQQANEMETLSGDGMQDGRQLNP